jgi:hypothetical protein
MSELPRDSVSTALGEILGIEQDRLRAEADERVRSEEQQRRRREEQGRLRAAEERLRADEEARRRADEERREREEVERLEHQRRLEELRQRQEAEGRVRLAEEELRLRHERELAVLEAARRRIPAWTWVVMATLLTAGGGASIAAYVNYVQAEEELAAASQRHERDRLAWESTRQELRRELRASEEARKELQQDVRDTERRVAELAPLVERSRLDGERIRQLAAENVRLQQRLEEIQQAQPPPNRPPDRPPHQPPTGISQPPPRLRCVNVGTPLEECFTCPGDDRC